MRLRSTDENAVQCICLFCDEAIDRALTSIKDRSDLLRQRKLALAWTAAPASRIEALGRGDQSPLRDMGYRIGD